MKAESSPMHAPACEKGAGVNSKSANSVSHARAQCDGNAFTALELMQVMHERMEPLTNQADDEPALSCINYAPEHSSS